MAFAIPEAGFALGSVAAILLELLGYCIALGLLWTWRNTIGLALLHLADSLNIQVKVYGHTIFGFDFGGPIRSANSLVEQFLSDWAVGADIVVGRLWHTLGLVFSVTGYEIARLAHDTFALGLHIVHRAIPDAIGAAVGDVRGAIKLAKGAYGGLLSAFLTVKHQFFAEVHGIGSSLRSAWHAITWTEHELLRWEKQVTHALRHAGHAVITDTVGKAVHDLPVPWGRTLRDLKRLARKHEGLFAASVMAGVMANVLGLPNWRCLTRGNIGRVSRALCGLSTHALNDLLGLLVDLLVLENICEAITLMEQGFGLVEPTLADWLGTATAQFVHCGYDTAPTLQLPALHYPAGAPAASGAHPTQLQVPQLFTLTAG